MTIRELQQKYNLEKTDFWEMKRGSRSIWIITHDAVEKIAIIENVIFHRPKWLSKGDNGTWAMELSGRLPNGLEMWTTGEASAENCKNPYPVAMCEKRARNRLVLKLVSAYQYGIYSDSEADSFRRPENGGQASPPPSQ